MHQDHAQAVLHLALLAAAHALELLGDVQPVDRVRAVRAQGARLLPGPGVEVLLIDSRGLRSLHGPSERRAALAGPARPPVLA
jgi:hypothetical protein